MTPFHASSHDDRTDHSLAQRAGELADDTTSRIRAGLQDSKATLKQLQASAIAHARAAGRAADTELHDSPWRAVGIAAGIGLLVGLLFGRR